MAELELELGSGMKMGDEEEEERIVQFGKESSEFFKEYKFLFGFRMTEVLLVVPEDEGKDGGGGKVPLDHEFFGNDEKLERLKSTALQLTQLGESLLSEFIPKTELIKRLKTGRKCGAKKLEQIVHFERFLREKKDEGNSNEEEESNDKSSAILDVGSGVGHLANCLNQCGYKVYAVEQNPEYRKNYGKDVTIFSLKVEEDTLQKLKLDVDQHSSPITLIGLHPCGNLVPFCIQAFVNCTQYKRLSIASCCYHKMTGENLRPMSQHSSFTFGYEISFLRLASERRDLNFGEVGGLQKEVEQVMCRAVAEVVKDKLENKMKKYDEGLEKCLEQLDGDDEGQQEFRRVYQENRHYLPRIRNLLLSHSAVQRLCELYVLLDRFAFLRENNFTPILYSRLLPEPNTPRGEILYCEKQ